MTQGLTYTVDIVLCIDATGSMGSIIEEVKKRALSFYTDVKERLAEKERVVDTLRLKVVSYRDYYCDGDGAMKESPFFTLPEQDGDFRNFVNGIKADGGGDEPESGMEALAIAINSEWSRKGERKRQIIVVWSDASAHPLEKSGKPAHYPATMPKNFDELTDMWNGQGPMSSNAQRIIMYTPDAYPWTDIFEHWKYAIHYASKAGGGLAEIDYSSMLDQIAASV
jgi:hypothetical protein